MARKGWTFVTKFRELWLPKTGMYVGGKFVSLRKKGGKVRVIKKPLTGRGSLMDEEAGCKVSDKSQPYIFGKLADWFRSRKVLLGFRKKGGNSMTRNRTLDVKEILQNGFQANNINDVSIQTTFTGGQFRHSVTIPNLSDDELNDLVALIEYGRATWATMENQPGAKKAKA